MLSLVLGGARSGKSRFAQSLCATGPRVAYIATALPDDDEMRKRIARHQSDRPAHWVTVEEPLDIARAAERCATECNFILLDCLTLWLSNICAAHPDYEVERLRTLAAEELARFTSRAGGAHCVVVSNEVGYGLVPAFPLGRLFRDLQGWVNQDAARAADFVYLVVAGIPLNIKQPETNRTA